jgi:hypothetical protein
METIATIYGECNAISRVTSRDTWPPAWLVPPDKPKAEPATEPVAEPDVATPEIDDEPSSLAWEAAQTPQEADTRLAAALSEFEPVRFEPLLTSEQAREKLAEMVVDADEWIERVGADGRRGWDRPGQLVKSRWWENSSLDELPSWSDAYDMVPPITLPAEKLPKTCARSNVGMLPRATTESNSLTIPNQRSLDL